MNERPLFVHISRDFPVIDKRIVV